MKFAENQLEAVANYYILKYLLKKYVGTDTLIERGYDQSSSVVQHLSNLESETPCVYSPQFISEFRKAIVEDLKKKQDDPKNHGNNGLPNFLYCGIYASHILSDTVRKFPNDFPFGSTMNTRVALEHSLPVRLYEDGLIDACGERLQYPNEPKHDYQYFGYDYGRLCLNQLDLRKLPAFVRSYEELVAVPVEKGQTVTVVSKSFWGDVVKEQKTVDKDNMYIVVNGRDNPHDSLEGLNKEKLLSGNVEGLSKVELAYKDDVFKFPDTYDYIQESENRWVCLDRKPKPALYVVCDRNLQIEDKKAFPGDVISFSTDGRSPSIYPKEHTSSVRLFTHTEDEGFKSVGSSLQSIASRFKLGDYCSLVKTVGI